MTTKQDRSYLHALTCDLVYKAYIDRNSSKATKLKKQIMYICFRKEFDIDHLRKFSVTFSLCRLYSPTCGSVLFHCSPFLGAPFCFTFFFIFLFFAFSNIITSVSRLLDALLIILEPWCCFSQRSPSPT